MFLGHVADGPGSIASEINRSVETVDMRPIYVSFGMTNV